MRHLEEIKKFIQPPHLEKSALEHIKSLSSQEFIEGVVIDNFLNEELVDRLQHVIDEEAVYQKHFKLFGNKPPVSEEVFYQAPEETRFLSRRFIAGVKPEYSMSKNWLSYLLFRTFYRSFFANYLDSITGYELELEADFTHSHQFEHYLKKHTDEVTGGKRKRRICTVLYLSRDWRSEYGGDLIMCMEDGRDKRIEAKCNRVVLFYPTQKSSHYVTRHNEIARDKTRTCHVAWYCDRD